MTPYHRHNKTMKQTMKQSLFHACLITGITKQHDSKVLRVLVYSSTLLLVKCNCYVSLTTFEFNIFEFNIFEGRCVRAALRA